MNIDALLEVERAFWQAAGDADFYRDNFAEDGVLVFATGVMDKPTVIESMADATPWESFEIEDPVLVRVDEHVAAIAYEALGRRNGSDYRANVSSVYRHDDGSWRLVLHQQTPKSESGRRPTSQA